MDTPAPPPARRRHWRALLVALVALPLVSAGYAAYEEWIDTYHLKAVRAGVLYRDGVQSMEDFDNAVDRVKPRTVVCLVDEQEMADPRKPQFREEVQFLKAEGIRMEHIPVRLGGWPKSEDVRRFLDVVNDPKNQPVLVHCAQGVRRTGMMVAAYQMSVEGLDKRQAKERIETFGHSDRTIQDLKKFIDIYDPGTRAVTKTLPVGRE